MNREGHKRTIKIIEGSEQVFYLVPASHYEWAKKKLKRERKKIENHNAMRSYYRRVVKEKIKEIDLLIERITKTIDDDKRI